MKAKILGKVEMTVVLTDEGICRREQWPTLLRWWEHNSEANGELKMIVCDELKSRKLEKEYQEIKTV